MADLSVIIPSRNEMFLARTVQDILENIRGNTEVIAVCDGSWPDPHLDDDPRLQVIYCPEPVGQRAAINKGVALSRATYVMKIDAHCRVDEGFDVKLMADMQDDWTVTPAMHNFHIFNWVCKSVLHLDRENEERKKHTRYQGPSGACQECGKETVMDIVWFKKPSPRSTSFCFDPEPHFQYFGDFRKRPEGQAPLSETMSLQGSCFMLARDKYIELNVCDEAWGTWGSQGIEVACKTWLSGGTVMCNHNTWYAHCFRTQGGDFGFPYHLSGRQVDHAKRTARDLFFNNKWDKQIRPLSWLVERFWPVSRWTDEDLAKIKEKDHLFVPAVIHREPTKGIVYYTDNRLDDNIMRACQKQLEQAARNCCKIVSVSLQPIDFGENIVLPLERGYLTMFKQILAGLEAIDTDIVFFAEHDVLYHESHFDFVPEKRDVFYYNRHVYKVRLSDGFSLHYDCDQTSGLSAYRSLLLDHYRKRVEVVERTGFSRKIGFEPGTHRRAERIDDYTSEFWFSACPNLDIRHGKNLTESRWRQDQFRNKSTCQNWIETTVDKIPGWEDYCLESLNE